MIYFYKYYFLNNFLLIDLFLLIVFEGNFFYLFIYIFDFIVIYILEYLLWGIFLLEIIFVYFKIHYNGWYILVIEFILFFSLEFI